MIKSLRHRLRGLRLAIGAGHCHLHGMGYVWLGAKDSAADWMSFLIDGFDPQMAHALNERRYRVMEMEKQAAAHLGIGVFACESDHIFLQDRYEQLLIDIVSSEKPSHLDRIGDFNIDDYREWITLVICDDITNIGEELSEGNFRRNIHVHPRFGFLLADLDSTSSQIHAKISVHGTKAGFKVKRFREEMNEVHGYLDKACRLLRMTHLDFDRSLPMRHIIACCEQICMAQKELEPVLRGMHVFIGTAFYIRENGVLEIPVNFSIR